jgi:dihydrofolate synthase/folylpolyglutamate synthase
VGELRSSLERRAPSRPVSTRHQEAETVLGVPSGGQQIQPTLFEFTAVMALKYFAEQNCDLVIWETGLGGRLDATNIVTPLASVITNIALDHTQWLGDTLEKIAVEKAGIIKSGIPVVTATAAPEALSVIERIAREKNAPLTRVMADASVRSSAFRRLPQAARLKAEPQTEGALSLLGEHQKLNAALALATVEVLQQQIPVADEAIRSGLANVNWPGRLQLIQQPNGRKILLDGAHNPAGAAALRDALTRDFAGTPPVFIFGVLADKNWPGICRQLAPLAAKIFTVPVASERTADPAELEKVFRRENPRLAVTSCNHLSDALNASKDEPFVVITGSLYLIGEALERLGLSPAGTGERSLNEWTAPKKQR